MPWETFVTIPRTPALENKGAMSTFATTFPALVVTG